MAVKALFVGLALALCGSMLAASPAVAQNSSQHLAKNDGRFLSKLAREDESEIKLAHLALEKSPSPKIKQYAQSILSADPSMQDQARNIAENNGMTIPQAGNDSGKAEYTKLSILSGPKFDREYMKYEAWKQKQDLQLVRAEISSTKNQTVKNYASQEEAPVQQASQTAQELATTMGVEAYSSTNH